MSVLLRGGRRDAEPLADGVAEVGPEAEGEGVEDILMPASSCDVSDMVAQIDVVFVGGSRSKECV